MNMKDGRLSGRPGSNKKIGMLDWVNIRRLDFHQKCNGKPMNFTKKSHIGNDKTQEGGRRKLREEGARCH